ncbi:hypothetical protein D9M69_503480 [compost metagenome]
MQQDAAFVRHQPQVPLGDMVGRLAVATPPGIAERPQRHQQVATAQAVDHHQQMHRQCQPTVRHRLQHQQQQAKQRHRQQYQHAQARPGRGGTGLEPDQQTQPGPILLDMPTPAGELLHPQHQQQYQKTHFPLLCSCSAARKRAQSKHGPGSVLRPGAMSLCPQIRPRPISG